MIKQISGYCFDCGELLKDMLNMYLDIWNGCISRKSGNLSEIRGGKEGKL